MTIDFITYFFAIINVIGTILNIKMSYWSFVLWTLCNVFWLIYDFVTRQYARIITDTVNLVTSVWGMIEWSKHRGK